MVSLPRPDRVRKGAFVTNGSAGHRRHHLSIHDHIAIIIGGIAAFLLIIPFKLLSGARLRSSYGRGLVEPHVPQIRCAIG